MRGSCIRCREIGDLDAVGVCYGCRIEDADRADRERLRVLATGATQPAPRLEEEIFADAED